MITNTTDKNRRVKRSNWMIAEQFIAAAIMYSFGIIIAFTIDKEKIWPMPLILPAFAFFTTLFITNALFERIEVDETRLIITNNFKETIKIPFSTIREIKLIERRGQGHYGAMQGMEIWFVGCPKSHRFYFDTISKMQLIQLIHDIKGHCSRLTKEPTEIHIETDRFIWVMGFALSIVLGVIFCVL